MGPAATVFDLRSATVRDVVRQSASQVVSTYRPDSAIPARSDTPRPDPLHSEARIAAALRVGAPKVTTPRPAPRLPQRPPPCDGFISCGIESLLGLEDFDDESYGRVERNRLMNQGSFMDSSRIHSSITLPMAPAETQRAGAPHRP